MGVSFFNYLPGVILSVLIALIGIFFSDYLGTEFMGFDKSPISSIMLAIIIGLLVGNTFKPTYRVQTDMYGGAVHISIAFPKGPQATKQKAHVEMNQ